MMPLVLIIFLNGAFERLAQSAQATALANAFTAGCYGVDAIRFNPAALSLMIQNQFLAGYEYTFSGIEGLHNINICFARRIFGGGVGVQLSEFGFSEQKEQALTLAYGSNFSKDFKFGLGSDFYIINNKRTGSHFAFALNVGFLGKLYKRWSLGIFGHNLNRPQFGSGEEGELPAEIKAGLAYEPFEGILSEIDLSMIDNDLRIHIAGEFMLFEIIFLRTGVKTNPNVLSGGISALYKFIKIDYAAEFVPELPLTHSMSVKFDF